MRKAVLYARVSSEAQEKQRTIESQIAELKRQVARTGNVLVKEYIDDGYSGFYLDRPAMNQLREDIKTNAFDAVYFLAADRIARDSTYQNIIVEELIRHKKQIVIGGKDYVDNPENKFTLTVFGAMSEYERAKIIERSMRGRKHWLKQGVLMSNGCITYGYKYHPRTLESHASYEIDKNEAPVVQRIFEMYAKGDIGFKQIARKLKAEKAYRRPGTKPWNWSSIHHMLHNEMYTGVRYFDTMTDANEEQDRMQKIKARKMVMRDRRDWIGIPIPAIISKELFEVVKARLDHNKKCYRNAKGKQLLSGLIWCSKCGSPCWSFRQYFWIKRSRDIKRIYEKYLYTCSGRRKVGLCTTTQIDVRPLDTCVFNMIRESMLEPDTLRECLKNLNRRTNKQKVDREVKIIEEKVKATVTKKNRITDLYASGDLGKEEYLKRIGTYDNEAAALTAKKSELIRRAPVVLKPEAIEDALRTHCEVIKERFEQCVDAEAKRRFLVDFIERVTYRNDHVTVEGLIPVGEGKITFVIKRPIDRVQLREQVLQHDRKVGLRGTPIQRVHWNHLADNAKILKSTKL